VGAISLNLPENPRNPDCLADDAVQCEPLSVRNSLLYRENTGNLTNFGAIKGDRLLENPAKTATYGEIPCSRGTGNSFVRIREYYVLYREFEQRSGIQEKRAPKRKFFLFRAPQSDRTALAEGGVEQRQQLWRIMFGRLNLTPRA
jgi:hypothetical protein